MTEQLGEAIIRRAAAARRIEQTRGAWHRSGDV
jgi:hypothetical protein